MNAGGPLLAAGVEGPPFPAVTSGCRFLPARASIIAKSCFRPPRPDGIPMAAAAVFRDVCGTEGVEGNVHASRAWKGNDQQRCVCAPASRYFLHVRNEMMILGCLRLCGPRLRQGRFVPPPAKSRSFDSGGEAPPALRMTLLNGVRVQDETDLRRAKSEERAAKEQRKRSAY